MLNKRRKLRRSGRIDEADIPAEKINEMICKGRERRLSSISNCTSKELCDTVNGKSQRNGNIAINGVPINLSVLNSYFATVATDLDYDEQKVLSYRVNLSVNDTYDNSVVDDYEIEAMLRHMKSTVPGVDKLPAWLFRICSFEISGVIAGILNLSLSTGKVPDNRSCAMVTPVPQQFADFRPISVTPIISRVAERLDG